jgi:short-subunit dehydrogenase/ubiquinone/menaquinone biosynthesis C-methylase UbiE/uncharacterized protein YbaR (Trm112 family)
MRKTTFWIGFGLGGAILSAALIKRRRQAKIQSWNRAFVSQKSPTALVTGASSGIGEAYARRLAALGYKLILVARREERLKGLATRLSQEFAVKTEVLPADLTTFEGIDLIEKRIQKGGDVDFLVNSAGYGLNRNFAETPIEATLDMINCHTLASVRLTRAALPRMIARRHGAVINVSSLSAFIPMARGATYSASKIYLNNFSEALHMELRGSGVRVQALCPGYTRTGFHDTPQYAEVREYLPAWLWSSAEGVVEASFTALEQDRVICIPGLQNRLVAAVARLGITSPLINLYTGFFPRSTSLPLSKPSLELLACPACHGTLRLTGDLRSGSLTCQNCQKVYSIIDGIPRFAPYEELTGLNQRFAQYYDWFSYVYASFSKLALFLIGGSEKRMRREIIDRLEPSGGRVLEVSIGPGVNLPYLVGQPGIGSVYGLDLSVGQLKQCRAYAQRQSWDVDLFQGNAEGLPFKDETFDSVFHLGGINFFNDKKRAIDEMIRVARPGAKIVISDETERGAHEYELAVPGFKHIFEGQRETVIPPVDLIPPEMEEIKLDTSVWRGWFYCIEFRKPLPKPVLDMVKRRLTKKN